eukprot:scaffold11.g3912.t1
MQPSDPEAPGAAFYAQRLARARAVPPERRSPCVRAFLMADALLCEAADVLPPAPGAAARGSADEQVVAQIKLMQAGMSVLEGQPIPLHNTRTHSIDFLVVQVQPLIVTILESNPTGIGAVMAPTPQLAQLLLSNAPVSDVRTLVRLLELTYALPALKVQHETAFHCLDFVERSLTDASTSAAIDRQLAAIRAGPAARSAAEGWQLPTAEGLHALVLALRICTCAEVLNGDVEVSLHGIDFRTQHAMAARQLAHLRPQDPNVHFALGQASALANAGPSATLRHWYHGMRLARQQGNLALIARFGYELAFVEIQLRPALGVGRELLEEADAAMAACKALLPEQWSRILRKKRSAVHAARQAHESGGRPPSGDEIVVLYYPRCSGCGQLSFGLRACSRCRQARFCSRECFVRSWPAHKAACKAAVQVAGRSQVGAASDGVDAGG